MLFFPAVGPFARRKLFIAGPFALALTCCCIFLAAALAHSQSAGQTSPPQQQQQSAAPSTPAAQIPSPRAIFVVVLDPAHGGTDTGARGSTGAVEKDLTLEIARATRTQLLQLGLHAILTRDGDEDPSFDDRAAVANAQPSAILVSFHVSSTGQIGTARAYSYLFSTNVGSADADAPADTPPHPASRLTPWVSAQASYVDASHRLADLIQAELALKFPGSPSASVAFPARDLRSVAAPAVAVELSSVTVQDPQALAPMIATLASSVARSIVAFHSTYAEGAH